MHIWQNIFCKFSLRHGAKHVTKSRTKNRYNFSMKTFLASILMPKHRARLEEKSHAPVSEMAENNQKKIGKPRKKGDFSPCFSILNSTEPSNAKPVFTTIEEEDFETKIMKNNRSVERSVLFSQLLPKVLLTLKKFEFESQSAHCL